eukprot:8417649-Pyramimonas_sp.AAC.1
MGEAPPRNLVLLYFNNQLVLCTPQQLRAASEHENALYSVTQKPKPLERRPVMDALDIGSRYLDLSHQSAPAGADHDRDERGAPADVPEGHPESGGGGD